MTMPLRSVPRLPPIAVSPGLIQIRLTRRNSPRRGSCLRHLPHQRVGRRPRSFRPMSPSAARSLCRGNGRAFLPWLRPPPAARCRCRASAPRMLRPKRQIRQSSPPPAIALGSTAIANARPASLLQDSAALHAHRLVAVRGKPPEDLLGVSGISGLHRNIELGTLGRHVEEQPVVIDRQDIGGKLTEPARDLTQNPRPIRNRKTKRHDPGLALEFPYHDRGQNAGIDIAATED